MLRIKCLGVLFFILDTRVLDEPSTTPCLKAKTAIQNYGVISDSLNYLLDNINTQRQEFLDEARMSNDKVKEFENAAIRSGKDRLQLSFF